MTTTERAVASDHLRQALNADSPSEKDYHIRSALQALIVDTAGTE